MAQGRAGIARGYRIVESAGGESSGGALTGQGDDALAAAGGAREGSSSGTGAVGGSQPVRSRAAAAAAAVAAAEANRSARSAASTLDSLLGPGPTASSQAAQISDADQPAGEVEKKKGWEVDEELDENSLFTDDVFVCQDSSDDSEEEE